MEIGCTQSSHYKSLMFLISWNKIWKHVISINFQADIGTITKDELRRSEYWARMVYGINLDGQRSQKLHKKWT